MNPKRKAQFFIMSIAAIMVMLVVTTALLPKFPPHIAYAQSESSVKCGSIVDGEFTKEGETHEYLLNMATQESFVITIKTFVDHLAFFAEAYGPTGRLIADVCPNCAKKEIAISSGTLAKGTYKVNLHNSGVGPYTLSVGCITVNGEVKPGDIPTPTPKSTPAPLPTPTTRAAQPETKSEFAFGFPGLAPVDFSDIGSAPLVLDVPNVGRLPKGNEILGFTLEAQAGDVLDLSYTRISGNMNLGLVVLSADNQVYFQASLVTSDSLSTRFTLPEAGEYTIGVFRISLVEPEIVKPTVFRLQGGLNSK